MDAYKPYLPEIGSKYLEANGHGRNFELTVNYVLNQLNLLDHENEYLKRKVRNHIYSMWDNLYKAKLL